MGCSGAGASCCCKSRGRGCPRARGGALCSSQLTNQPISNRTTQKLRPGHSMYVLDPSSARCAPAVSAARPSAHSPHPLGGRVEPPDQRRSATAKLGSGQSTDTLDPHAAAGSSRRRSRCRRIRTAAHEALLSCASSVCHERDLQGVAAPRERDVKAGDELTPSVRGAHEAHHGVEMLRQRWMTNVLGEPYRKYRG